MLQEKAMLTNLTIHAWTARRQDSSVTAQVEASNNATSAGAFNKQLVNKESLKPITQLIGKIRTTHYERTLPWGDNGDRLLPSLMYLEYMGEMRQLQGEFDNLANLFVHQYPAEVQAARVRLGNMYKADDYPDPGQIKSRFGIQLSLNPVPDAKDFRVDVGAEEVEVIRQNITKQVMKQQQEAVKDLWRRLHVVVSKVDERLSIDDAKIFDSLIDNVVNTASLMKKLNLTNDEKLNAVVKEVEDRICFITPNRLRDDKVLRKQVAESARDILTKFPA